MRRDPSLTRQMLLCGDGDQMAYKVPLKPSLGLIQGKVSTKDNLMKKGGQGIQVAM